MRLTIGLGEVYDLKPVAIDRTGAERSDVSVKLATSNKKYVAVNGTQVKGVKVGSATITITEGDCEPLKVKITVAKAPKKVTLSQTAATVSEGETLKLTAALPGSAGTVRWAVEDAKVLSIESMSDDTFTVEIRTLAKGKTRVKATSYDGKKSALCTITVADAPEGIVFGAAKYEIAQGLTRKPETVMLPATAKAAVQYELEDAGHCVRRRERQCDGAFAGRDEAEGDGCKLQERHAHGDFCGNGNRRHAALHRGEGGT